MSFPRLGRGGPFGFEFAFPSKHNSLFWRVGYAHHVLSSRLCVIDVRSGKLMGGCYWLQMSVEAGRRAYDEGHEVTPIYYGFIDVLASVPLFKEPVS